MSSDFWAGGPDAYYKALRQQYDSQTSALREQLRDCANDAQREEIRSRIRATKREFKSKFKEIGRLDF